MFILLETKRPMLRPPKAADIGRRGTFVPAQIAVLDRAAYMTRKMGA